ncbi:uncharacterized protein LAJ45_11190 [Morchella importuna]|uniref:uncharacterized protein n=1 Tax=Morchella importuna TaxID=1174673 RepID=UPI001E8EEDE1|nr:uncharacterized protein LAJ45_11209 [Morchella importuna]XP_045966098.1 uncharacterized protein LAJ45_11190 [Morchella importuna]KAH8144774.1 hypothetical protein LAJ45_11209 [Morchella importuna]KAH8144794.1 hypothetical protein LAJ45_11190 [Morchella importuna]
MKLAEVLADLTSLKTISAVDALNLVSPNYTRTSSMKTEDDDLTRAESFLTLQSEQGTRENLLSDTASLVY